ncbi:cytochrome c [Hymenobacter sp. BT175]|uniref:c-type cytochrome n=1 Tax=Hymenobacter translucens TaxID=2886507 RepID=UPI001D0DFF03|nr:c-type cytochrome [Hymenobacter translucens]MCC2545315.1 cytochrome c [Hymenobacter translucens]
MKQLFALLTVLALCSIPAAAQKKPVPKTKAKTSASGAVSGAVLAKGKAVYVQNCLTCHQADGLGVDEMNPPLSKTSYVLGDKARLVNIILNGMQGQDIDGEPYRNLMPSFSTLTDQQIADVLTYVRSSFGNKTSAVQAAEVKTIRAANKK